MAPSRRTLFNPRPLAIAIHLICGLLLAIAVAYTLNLDGDFPGGGQTYAVTVEKDARANVWWETLRRIDVSQDILIADGVLNEQAANERTEFTSAWSANFSRKVILFERPYWSRLEHFKASAIAAMPGITGGEPTTHECAIGFPFRCFTGAQWWVLSPGGGVASLNHCDGFIMFKNRSLPVRPIIPGILLNTILYALLVAVAHRTAIWLFNRSRRRSRTRRGLCPTCSYPRTGLAPIAPCPECGSATA